MIADPNQLSLSQLLESAAGPSPWYCRHPISSTLGPLRWQRSAIRDDINLLVDIDDTPRLALPFFIWFRPLDDGRMLLWRSQRDFNRQVSVEIVNLDQLRPLTELEAWLTRNPMPGSPFYSTAPQFAGSFQFVPALEPGMHQFVLPVAFFDVPEFFVITDNSLLPTIPNGASCCIYAIDPGRGTIDVLPQDWFNEGPIDIGYQWITRITRHPATGRLIGGGIRIENFVLDETGRRIASRF
jgi:hypothetical protein